MISPSFGMLLVCLVLGAMFGGLKLIQVSFHPHPELIRKLMHVGMGLSVLTFPWIFRSSWPVVLLAGSSALFLTAIKFVPRLRDGIGTVLNAVHRPSLGEICFPVSVASLVLLSRNEKILYIVPMLILTFADAIAALAGVIYGKVRYLTSDGLKSAEGSITFLFIAFLSVHIPLLLCTDIGRPQTLLIAALIAILSMLVEAISAHGMDNLLIPLGAFAFLRLYQYATIDSLLFRLVAVIALVIFLLCWRRRSTLDDSALIASALFGYGAAMLGGIPWVAGPLMLFLFHVAIWPQFGRPREHTVYAVASVTLAGLFWLILRSAYGGDIGMFMPYAIGFGAHLAIIGVSRIARSPSPQSQKVRLVYSVLFGWLMTLLQLMLFLSHTANTMHLSHVIIMAFAALFGVALSAVGFYKSIEYLYGPKGSASMIHFAGFTTAFVGSVFAAGLQIAIERS